MQPLSNRTNLGFRLTNSMTPWEFRDNISPGSRVVAFTNKQTQKHYFIKSTGLAAIYAKINIIRQFIWSINGQWDRRTYHRRWATRRHQQDSLVHRRRPVTAIYKVHDGSCTESWGTLQNTFTLLTIDLCLYTVLTRPPLLVKIPQCELYGGFALSEAKKCEVWRGTYPSTWG